jgi:hypothetical protein
MIELRWVRLGERRFLEYRSRIPTWQASGAWGEPSVWGKWRDVDEIDVNDAAYEDLAASGGLQAMP